MFQRSRHPFVFASAFLLVAALAAAQSNHGKISGHVTDQTGGVLPGVTVELRGSGIMPMETVTDGVGAYSFDSVAPGTYQLDFSLINFASATHRDLVVRAGETGTGEGLLRSRLK